MGAALGLVAGEVDVGGPRGRGLVQPYLGRPSVARSWNTVPLPARGPVGSDVMLVSSISVRNRPRVLVLAGGPGPGLRSGDFGALAYLVADTADAAPGRGERLQVRLYLAGARLAAVQRGADTADTRDVPGLDLVGEHALGFGAVAVQPVSGSGYSGYGFGCVRKSVSRNGFRVRTLT